MPGKRSTKQEPLSIDWLNDTEWVYAPMQDRSRKALRQILTAAKKLFIAKGFDETRVTEISKTSGISIGSIYNRFPDKLSIFYAVLESFRRSRFAQIEEMTQPHLWQNKGPVDVLDFHLEVIFSALRTDGGFFRLVERQRIVNPIVRDIMVEWNEHFCSVISGLMRPYGDRINLKDIDKKIRYVHNIIRGSAVWSILPMDPGNHPLDVNGKEYQQEARKMAMAYLGLKE